VYLVRVAPPERLGIKSRRSVAIFFYSLRDGDLYARGIRGIVLEAFGVGNMPWTKQTGWIPWLRWGCTS
jgi:hypothetical protein